MSRAAWAAHLAEPATAKRRASGAKGQSVGATAELQVHDLVQYWTCLGKAALTRGHPGVRFVRPGYAVPISKGTVDFVGLLYGVSVAFDVKATTKPDFCVNATTLPDHERDFLRTHYIAGGYAFLLVCTEAQTRPRWSVWRLYAQGDIWGWTRTDLRTLEDLPARLLGHRATTGA